MSRFSSTTLAGLAGVALAVGLGGCVTLFPKETPSPLYRFGDNVPAASPVARGFGVRVTGIAFDQAAAGDEILTVQGGEEVAYISGGRWAAPAPVMFAAALRKGFDGSGVRLLQPGEAGLSPYTMRVDVTRFEARYDHGAAGAPTIVVRVHASLTRASDQALVGGKDFDVSAAASDNRVSAIAEAFDQATGQAVSQLVGWVSQAGGQPGG